MLATDPALRFLSTISGVGEENLAEAVGLLDAQCWSRVRPAVIVSTVLCGEGEALLQEAGLVRAADRGLWTRRLDGGR